MRGTRKEPPRKYFFHIPWPNVFLFFERILVRSRHCNFACDRILSWSDCIQSYSRNGPSDHSILAILGAHNFYVTDLIGRDEVEIEYCNTDEMLADYNTKPVVGRKFLLFRDRFMNLTGKHHRILQQECVGRQGIKRKLNNCGFWIIRSRSSQSQIIGK
jgi:hypothetical protein